VAAAVLGLPGNALESGQEWIVQVDHAANGHVDATVLRPRSTPKSISIPSLSPIPVGDITWDPTTTSCVPNEFPAYCVDLMDTSYTQQPLIAEPVASDRVILDAVPDAGYFFSGWTVTNGSPTLNPCGDDPVCEIPFQQRADVTPIFGACPSGHECLTVVSTPSGTGSVAALSGSTPLSPDVQTGTLSTYYVHDGDQIKLVPSGSSGAVLSSWNGCTENGDKSCSITISGTTVVTATFADQITVDKNDVNGPSQNLLIAAFDTTGAYIDDAASDGCVYSATTCVYMLPPGANYVLLRASVNYPSTSSDYHSVLSWSDCIPEVEDDYCDLTATGSSTVDANDLTYWNYHVQQGAHGTITSSPSGLDCGPSSNSCDALFPVGSTVTLTSTADTSYTSVGFDNGVVSGSVGSIDCPAQSATCNVTLDHDPLTIGANVWPNIQVNAVGPGGAIAWIGGGPHATCGTDATPSLCRAFGPGGDASVSENATSPSVFAGWSGGGCAGTASSCSPSVSAPATVTATFTGLVSFSATATSQGSVSVSPTPTTCGPNQCFTSGTVVTVTETPGTNNAFIQWTSGPCDTQTTRTCVFTIESNTSMNANFTSGQPVHVLVVGHGSVSSSPAGIDLCTFDCTGYLAFGFSSAFTPTPATGWAFSGWSGGTSTSSLGVQQTCSGTGACHLFVGTPTSTYALTLTATFTQLDSVPPTISFAGTTPAPNAHGWNNTDVTTTWNCADTGSGPQAPTITQTLSANGANQLVTGTCFDNEGNSATDAEGTVSIDKTAPTVTATPNRSADANGWYNHAFTVTWGGTDALSGIDTCGGDPGYSGADTSSGTLDGSCTDLAGNTAPGTFGFKYDASPPTIAFVSRTPADGNGWNSGSVTVTWSCTDSGSGVVSSTVQQVVSAEGSNDSATGTCTDNAGNVSQDTVSGLKIDTTPPVVSASPSRAADANGWYNHALTVTWSATDALSGGVTCDAPQAYSGPDTSSQTLTGSCTDAAGNSASASFDVKFDATAPAISFSTRTAPNGDGWNDTPVTLTWDCTDGGSGPVAPTVSRTLSSDGANQSSTGTCTDEAGNTTSDSQNGVDIDTTAPTVTASPSDPANANGWNAAPFTIGWDGTDAVSGIATCSSDIAIAVETAGGSAQGSCTDLAGNSATATYPYKLDTEAPTLTAGDISATGTNAGLLVSAYSNVTANDNYGTPAVSCTPQAPYTFAAGQSTPVSCTATDAAGNQATGTFQVQVDGTPDLTIAASHDGTPARGDSADTLALVTRNSGLHASSGTVTVVDTLPAGFTASAISGTGWTCTLATTTCTRSDALGAGSPYPTITLTVAIAGTAADSVTNTAIVSGGSEPLAVAGNDTATDTIVLAAPQPPASTTTTTTTTSTTTPAATGAGAAPLTNTVQPGRPGTVLLPDTAKVVWPAGALPADTTVSVAASPATSGSTFLGPGATVVSIVASTPGGAIIHSLPSPLEIDFPNAPAGFVPQTSEDGLNWRAIPPLPTGGKLPAAQPDGYFRTGTTVRVFTRHLTLFAIAPPMATASAARKSHILTVTVTTTRKTHIDLALRSGGKSVGRWHRWLVSGKTTLKLSAGGMPTSRGPLTLVVTANGGGASKTSTLPVGVTK
jgi:hypothetical protein